ncbi:glutamate formiminotransferase / formiminotetrahydrofolate cyclodeaminase [Thermotomaculum hydrothermale]|uniref:Formimidoyltransferase-cyclodeaminase n=1 Tax=Thermotomaculum hydrothermale TaxID=981385 RepID=A0A7R6PGV2_9BACT|nr:glutamate formimidoyltransferase [Thermotomaculum hydrothermale]BBB33528.1 glutamate formiminotransferase / formiminotetrahydrofolate cyclodeaminase [Thermotomaculum hydrothermale]
MAKKLVECVPNFSEGRNKKVINAIVDAIKSAEGVEVLDVDPGYDTNRTVVTFIGEPDAVVEGAFRGIKKASELIDMSKHHGEHPRMGATDVCPFVPVNNITVEECVELAHKLAKRVGEELKIPVYLYEYAAQKPERKNLANIRKGEYEGLAEKLKDPEWKPDYGPAEFNPKSGATVIGVREFLIAYNITLNTREKLYATDIALEIREKGRPKRTGNIKPFYTYGNIVKHKEGEFYCGNCDFVAKTQEELFEHCEKEHNYDLKAIYKEHGIDYTNLVGKPSIKAGKFKFCKAIGWYVDEYKRAQISINLTNYKVTPPHIVLEEVRKLAAERGLTVTGSEVVGLIPFEALYQAGVYYLKKQGKSAGVPLDDVLKTAVYSMGLNDVSKFDIKEKVLGYPSLDDRKLINMSVKDLIDEVSRATPAPGGGSVSALASALGAALSSMVAGLTISKKKYLKVKDLMAEIGEEAQKIKDELVRGIDDDTDAFNEYFVALKMPKNTEEEKKAREKAMLEGLKKAISVPLKTAENSLKAIEVAIKVAENGNINSVTDAGVGGEVAYAGLRGAILNVLINLPGIEDKEFVNEMKKKCDSLLNNGQNLVEKLRKVVEEKIKQLEK